ncbi:MAG: hypothetical protein ACRCT1_15600 [Microcoleaceae cyanobacterium]
MQKPGFLTPNCHFCQEIIPRNPVSDDDREKPGFFTPNCHFCQEMIAKNRVS